MKLISNKLMKIVTDLVTGILGVVGLIVGMFVDVFGTISALIDLFASKESNKDKD